MQATTQGARAGAADLVLASAGTGLEESALVGALIGLAVDDDPGATTARFDSAV